jgi:hypothetical protein
MSILNYGKACALAYFSELQSSIKVIFDTLLMNLLVYKVTEYSKALCTLINITVAAN